MRNKANKKSAKPNRFRTIKIALIPVLLAALAFILFSNSEDAPRRDAGNAASTSGLASSAERAVADSTGLQASRTAVRGWPNVELDFLDGPNPFASYLLQRTEQEPARFVNTGENAAETPESNGIAELAQELAEQPVNYVFESGERKLLVLGGRQLEKGQYLSESVRIQDIRQGKLVLSVRRGNASQPHTSQLIQSPHQALSWPEAGQLGVALRVWKLVTDFWMVAVR